MKKGEIGELPNFFDRYIALVEDLDLLEGLQKYAPAYVFSDFEKYKALGDKIYAPGKWSLKEILQHCIDTERIMAFRSLCFARHDSTPLPGFDEDEYAKNTLANQRSLEDLMAEYDTVRQASVALFKSFDKAMFLHKGTANHSRISPLSLGFVIIGHALHHEKVLRERYYSL
jgi:DinB superfamily